MISTVYLHSRWVCLTLRDQPSVQKKKLKLKTLVFYQLNYPVKLTSVHGSSG